MSQVSKQSVGSSKPISNPSLHKSSTPSSPSKSVYKTDHHSPSSSTVFKSVTITSAPTHKSSSPSPSRKSKSETSPTRRESHYRRESEMRDGYRGKESEHRRESQYRRDSRMEPMLRANRRISMMWAYTRGPGSKTTGSTTDQGSIRGLRYENTYQLSPGDKNKFDAGRVKTMIESSLSGMLDGETYDALRCGKLSKLLCETIKDGMKQLGYPRYKYVCTVTLSQCTGQGVQVSSRCLWNNDTDCTVSAEYTSKTLQAVAMVFAAYRE